MPFKSDGILTRRCLTRLPSDFKELVNITELNLEGNMLDAIPLELLSLTGLKKLNISRNLISHVLPIFGSALRSLEVSFDLDSQIFSLLTGDRLVTQQTYRLWRDPRVSKFEGSALRLESNRRPSCNFTETLRTTRVIFGIQ